MTKSEEEREKVIELYSKGVSKTDIARIESISFPTIRNILNESDTKQNQEVINEKKEALTKTLTDIFNYETYLEESVIDLVFNLKRIAQISGSDLGDFVEALSFVFDKIHKHTDNPIKLFNFIVNISNYLSLLHDVVKPEAFLEIVELYYDNGIRFEEVNNLITEIEEKTDILIENAKEEYAYWGDKTNEIKEKYDTLCTSHSTTLKKLEKEEITNKKLKKTEEELKTMEEKLKILQVYAYKLGEKAKEIGIENQELKTKLNQSDKENNITKRDNGLIENLKREKTIMEIVLKEVQTNFPVEFEMIVNRVKNEIK